MKSWGVLMKSSGVQWILGGHHANFIVPCYIKQVLGGALFLTCNWRKTIDYFLMASNPKLIDFWRCIISIHPHGRVKVRSVLEIGYNNSDSKLGPKCDRVLLPSGSKDQNMLCQTWIVIDNTINLQTANSFLSHMIMHEENFTLSSGLF